MFVILQTIIICFSLLFTILELLTFDFILYIMSRSYSMFWMQMLLWEIVIRIYCLSSCRSLSFISSKCNQVTYYAANVKAIYSALIENTILIDCFLKHQYIRLLLSMKMNLNIDFRFFLILAQWVSKQLFTNSPLWSL